MIRFSLSCDQDHEFDGWFGSSEDFDLQSKRGLIACPACNSTQVEKALMAPSLSSCGGSEDLTVASLEGAQREVLAKIREMRDAVIADADHVGRAFPEEVRKIHYGEAEARGIYGEASGDEVQGLLDEGIGVAPLPVFPDDAN